MRANPPLPPPRFPLSKEYRAHSTLPMTEEGRQPDLSKIPLQGKSKQRRREESELLSWLYLCGITRKNHFGAIPHIGLLANTSSSGKSTHGTINARESPPFFLSKECRAHSTFPLMEEGHRDPLSRMPLHAMPTQRCPDESASLTWLYVCGVKIPVSGVIPHIG